jgi:hypothetical protein
MLVLLMEFMVHAVEMASCGMIYIPSCIRYSDWLRAGRQRGRGSSPGRVKNLFFSTSFRPAMGASQPPIQRVLGTLSLEVKRPGCETDHSPSSSA